MRGRLARRLLRHPAALFLAALHLAALGAGFLVPYRPGSQDRDLPYAPPSRLHLVDATGELHLVPFIYRWVPDESGEGYVEDRSRRFPLRIFAAGESYRLLGPLRWDRHLVSVDEPARLLLLGSDGFGRDQLSRLLYGARISLFAGLLAAAIALTLGTLVGLAAGYYGGRTDAFLMRATEVVMALPWLYLLMAVRAFLPLEMSPTRAFLMMVVVIGLIGWARPARLVRGIALSARERAYVHAARGFGASDGYLLRRHVLPEAISVVATQGTLMVPQYILAEVTLSFLGLGVAESAPSWGNMLGELQRYHVLASGWWWLGLPGIALVATVLAYHALSRDARLFGA